MSLTTLRLQKDGNTVLLLPDFLHLHHWRLPSPNETGSQSQYGRLCSRGNSRRLSVWEIEENVTTLLFQRSERWIRLSEHILDMRAAKHIMDLSPSPIIETECKVAKPCFSSQSKSQPVGEARPCFDRCDLIRSCHSVQPQHGNVWEFILSSDLCLMENRTSKFR